VIVIRSLSESSAQGYAARYEVRDIDRALNRSWPSPSLLTTLSERIEEEVGNVPSLLAKVAEKHKTFESPQRYARFLEAQLVMHSALVPLYDDPLLQRQFPQHTATNIITEIGFDLINLGRKENDNRAARKWLPQGFMNRLGWFYCSELLASMFATWREIATERGFTDNFVVSHFGRRADNSFRWPLLIETTDRLLLSEVEEDRIFAGARAAMVLFERQVRYMCDLPRRQYVGPDK